MKRHEEVIEQVEKYVLRREINQLSMVCKTNMVGNYIYITDHKKSPNIMREIGRLRELSFRFMGAGTGKEMDIDQYDTNIVPFSQLFVWDPENNEITGAYRFIEMSRLIDDSPTSHLFNLQPDFKKEIRPYTIELGRSFVNFDAKKVRYALHNLWDGLGFLIKEYPGVRYFFGKMTFYPWILEDKLDVLLSFLTEMFPSDDFVSPKESVSFSKINDFVKSLGLDQNRKILHKKFKEGKRKNVPPLVNAYVKLSETMRYLGASVNSRFGNVIEGCILITISDINPAVIEEHTRQLI
ncbi:MAG TPA: GNAT family N-acyltransferase [Candidatus Absconditabacterales bacterium]|nr:GNAT family N-acyltransferase [Candidatus Absconditabacterales bacterium]